MAMSKMFVHFNGTIEAFKQAGHETTYNNHIVFISGGNKGGVAVYTHGQYFGDVKEALAALQTSHGELSNKVDALKYFSKLSDGTTTASTAGADGTITIKGQDPSIVTVGIDASGFTIGLAEDFVKTVEEDLPGAISAVDSKLGEKNAPAASGSDATAFGRIKNLETIVAGLTGEEGGEVESVDAKITKAIGDLDVEASEGDYVASISQVDGKIVATTGTFNFDEAGAADAALAEAKSYADQAEANAISTAAADATSKADAALASAKEYTDGVSAQALVDAKAYTDEKVGEINEAAEALEGRVAANEVAIEVLNGEGEGSVKKSVADAIAGVVASAPEDFDTLKEVADWIASDTTGAAAMQADIATLKGGDTVEGSVAKTVKDAVAAEAEIARAAEQANAGAIDAIEADYLKAADKTELQGAIDDLAAEHAADEKVIAEALTDLNSKYETVVSDYAAADADTLAAAKAYADEEIAKLDVEDAAVENQFVTAVSEADGKISVSRSAINASQIGISNTDTDAFAAETQTVQDALTELASFWAWEEL